MHFLSAAFRRATRLSRLALLLRLLLVWPVLLVAWPGSRPVHASGIAAASNVEQYTLTIHVDGFGMGGVEVDPPGDTFAAGALVTLKAVPDPGSMFVGWSGDLSGDANPATLVMDRNRAVTATLEEDRRPIADAGAPQAVRPHAHVQLDGSRSFDPFSPALLSYHWVQQAGPAVILDNPSAARPSFVAPAVWDGPRVLTFALTVSNADGYSSQPVEVGVTVTPYVVYVPLCRNLQGP